MFDEIKKTNLARFLTFLPSNTLAGLWSCTVIPCRVKERAKGIRNYKIIFIIKPFPARLVLVQLVPWGPDSHITLEQYHLLSSIHRQLTGHSMNKKKTWNGSVALVVGHVVSQLGGFLHVWWRFLHSHLKAIPQQGSYSLNSDTSTK